MMLGSSQGGKDNQGDNSLVAISVFAALNFGRQIKPTLLTVLVIIVCLDGYPLQWPLFCDAPRNYGLNLRADSS
jgi:hypothetical protein